MNILLDSHALLWSLHTPGALRREARLIIEDPANLVFYSAAAVWELELKAAKGKLTIPKEWLDAARETGFEELPVAAVEAAASARLPWHHNDPFDRLFIAQAKAHRLHLATRDSLIKRYEVHLLTV